MKKKIESISNFLTKGVLVITIIGYMFSAIEVYSNVFYESDMDVNFYSEQIHDGFANIIMFRNNMSDKTINDIIFNFDNGVYVLEDLVGDLRVSDHDGFTYGENSFTITKLKPGESFEVSFVTDKKLYSDQLHFSKLNDNNIRIDVNDKNKNDTIKKLKTYIIIYSILGILIILILSYNICINRDKKKYKNRIMKKIVKH